uniref:Deoxyribonuclease-2-alpha n=1 Tax=Amphilophus citrinellus TaxID=61819 RepID=A0A3Q0RM49_AMPCI
MILLLQEVLWKLVFTVGLLGSLCEGSISCKNEGGADVYLSKAAHLPADYRLTIETSYVFNGGKDVTSAGTTMKFCDSAAVSRSVDVLLFLLSCVPSCSCSAGVVMKDNNAVVWLLHSTPRFPFSGEKKDFYPKSGETNAQIFLCCFIFTVYEKFQQISILLHFTVFQINTSKISKLIDLRRANLKKEPDGALIFYINTSDVILFAFAVGDLYVTIADELKSDLYIQTWKSRPDCISETNKGHELYNIVSVKTSVGEWKHGSDHSKWCVSVSKDWTCVADSNREESQFARPGGALCINSKPVTDAFKDLISNELLCSGEVKVQK